MKETTIRTTVRGFFWRIIVFLTTMAITYFLTGSIAAAMSVGALEFVIKLIIYVQFEKAFARLIKFGIKEGKPTTKRTMIKGLVWRTIATMSSMVLTAIVTGDTHSAGMFGMIAFPVKYALYIGYEQLIWKRIEWGLKPQMVTV